MDDRYRILYERTTPLPETTDEDGFPCEDIHALTTWAKEEIRLAQRLDQVAIKAINVSAYGASLVHLDEQGKPIGPLYNYLKPYSEKLLHSFLTTYDVDHALSLQTASPVLGSLNSGLQLYRIKNEQPLFFKEIRYSLHLPQYVSYLFTGKPLTELTSIGCHTLLWDYGKKQYHRWVVEENMDSKFPELAASHHTTTKNGETIGVGVHDSSAALIPYLKATSSPFALLSTGTWCISLNPFNQSALTKDELELDCLQYLSYEGKPVKASRLFAGYEHDQMVRKMASHFNVRPDVFTSIEFNVDLTATLLKKGIAPSRRPNKLGAPHSDFDQRDLSPFKTLEEAYHQLIIDIVRRQVKSTGLVLNNTPVKRIFVDGGFSDNSVYMNLLAAGFPQFDVYAASVPQASAVGAALIIHHSWNSRPLLPDEVIELRRCKRPDGIEVHPII